MISARLQKIYKTYGPRGLVVVGICEDPHNIDGIRNYISKSNIEYTIILDKDNKIGRQFGVISLPVTLIINKKQRIVFVHYGFSKAMIRRIEEEIEQVLKDNGL